MAGTMSEARADGTVVSAEVLRTEGDDVLVAFAKEDTARVPVRDFAQPPRVGARVSVFIDTLGADGAYLGSVEKAERLSALDRVEAAYHGRQTIEGEIVAAIEGGFIVDIGLRAFLPSSQLSLRPIKDPDQALGQRLGFRVLRFHRGRANVVLSRRPILEAERSELMGSVRVGAVVEGVIREFVDQGVRVDVRGIDGFIHNADLSWDKGESPSSVVSVGETRRLKVLRFDKKRGRVQLGLRQAQDDPWADADARYPVGTRVRGMVVSKTDFGCFLEFEPGLEGLIPLSGPLTTDAARERLRKADIGDELEATVVDVSLTSKRIGLQLVEPDA